MVVVEVGGVDGSIVLVGVHAHEEAAALAWLPVVVHVALTAGTLITKVVYRCLRTLSYELHTH